MPLWGTDPSSATNIPKYLSDSEDVKYNKGDAYANEHGWVMKAGSAATGNSNTSAAPEILVAISGLAGITTDGIAVQGYGPDESSLVLDSTDGTANAGDKVLLEMGGGLQFPTATQVRFVTTSHVNGTSKTMTVEISFDEEITVDGTGGTPQIVLANGQESGDTDGDATLAYTATGSTANQIRFTATNLTFSTNDVYTLGGGSQANINPNSGTITDAITGNNIDFALSHITAETITVTAS